MGLKGSWEDASYFHTLLNTNLFGVIHGISTFLPVLQQGASKDHPAAIVITGSKQGITNPPSNPAYNASKAAVKTLAEHLSFDLRNDADRLSVHLLVPGWTYTGLTGATPDRSQPEGAWTPEQVVEYLEKKMAAGQFYVICPDNDVTEDLDRRRILWSAGDIVEGRPPLNRWREDWKDKAAKGISEMKI
jgi:NAD(P)-dependent dehydrogenase (short-subunit alcohol dehydrogenase family)